MAAADRMRRRASSIVVTSLLAAAAAVRLAGAPQQPTALVITHVSVVDGAAVTPDQSIVIAGSRIAAVGSAATTAVPDGARVVDGRGTFAMAGLWDMHVHLASYPDGLPLFIAYGVTGARDMGSASAKETRAMQRWRREIAAGTRVGPRIVLAGPTVDGRRGFKSDGRVYAATPGEGTRAVATVRARGGDFVKVHDWLRLDAYRAVADAARAAGLDLVGHTPAAIPLDEVLAQGQRSIEHLGGSLGGFALDVSARETELRRDLVRRMDAALAAHDEDPFWKWAQGPDRVGTLADSWDEHRAASLVARLKQHDVWQTPTLTVLAPTPRRQGGDESRFVYASARAACAKTPPPARPAAADALFGRQQRLVALMRDAGVGLLTGTDAFAPGPEAVDEFGTCDVPVAGLSVHDELEWLVSSGLTPAEALATATVEPARFFREESVAGRIAAGRRADLVLVDASPLEDIRNSRRINAVVAAGRLFDRAAIEALRTRAAADASAR